MIEVEGLVRTDLQPRRTPTVVADIAEAAPTGRVKSDAGLGVSYADPRLRLGILGQAAR